MSTFKIAVFISAMLFSSAGIFTSGNVFGQVNSQNQPPVSPEGSKDFNQDFEAKMTKMQQAMAKLQAKEGKVKDPQMKADLSALLAKMNVANNDYNAMKNNSALSSEQQKESQKKIQGEMQEIRKMHDDMKAKYGDQAGGGKKGGNMKGKKQSDTTQPAEPGEDLK
jgi:Skp family chaperone for outer membrane proteins